MSPVPITAIPYRVVMDENSFVRGAADVIA
jgi:hypothetical protein